MLEHMNLVILVGNAHFFWVIQIIVASINEKELLVDGIEPMTSHRSGRSRPSPQFHSSPAALTLVFIDMFTKVLQ